MARLPKSPKKGEIQKIRNLKTGRSTCFKATGKKGFGKWLIIKCSEKRNPTIPQGNYFHPDVGWYD